MFKQRIKGENKIEFIFEPPVVFIEPLAYAKMANIVSICEKEVGWLGTATRDVENNSIFVHDVFLFEQEVSSVTCDITEEGLNEFANHVLQQENGMDILNNIKLWGHSHVNMGVTPSQTDNEQMEIFADNNDWFLRLIANKSGELSIDMYNYEHNIVIHDISWNLYIAEFEETYEFIEEEIKNKVKEQNYFTSYVSTPNKKNKKDKDDNITSLQDYCEDYGYDYTGYDKWTQLGKLSEEYFTIYEVEAIGSCENFEDAKREITELMGNTYTDQERLFIWYDCQDLLLGGDFNGL